MSGALAFYDGKELIIYDMPVHELKVNGKNRKRIDSIKLISILKDNKADLAFLEKVWAMPTNGVSAAFTYGWGCGALEASVASQMIPFTYVTPPKWKKVMDCPKDKNGARMRASQLLPNFAHNWDLKKHDGRAEAALIALYGMDYA